jgi:hypothetical protein
MATPADQRLLDLLDKWLKSLELHIKYSSLDDDSYSRIQPWPEHQRPSRWIIDLAKQKALALRAQVDERIKAGDAKFSDSLELMTFLANLVGAEHIERFIPLAHADSELTIAPAAATATTERAGTATAGAPSGASSDSATGTREMPKFTGGKQRTTGTSGTEQVARVERNALAKTAAPKPASKPAAARPAPAKPVPAKPTGMPKPAPEKAAPAKQVAASDQPPTADVSRSDTARADAARDQVIADAVRLVQWGRKWYELAEVIARMADRPSLTDVRRILKDNKADIDKKAGRT